MVDRESARFRAQQQRQMESIITKPRNPCEGPRFSEPIKTDKEDKNIKDILGSFSNIKNVMEPSSMYNFLGIPKEPPTPVDNRARQVFDLSGVTFTANGQVRSSKSENQSGNGSSLRKDQSGSSSSKSTVPHVKSGQKSKEAVKHGITPEQQGSKSRPGGSSVPGQLVSGRGISPVSTAKGHRSKDVDVKLNIKKEKDPDIGRPVDTSGTSSSSSLVVTKMKPSPGRSSDSSSKLLPKKGSTPMKSKSSQKPNTKPVMINSAKKDFKRPNGIINHEQLGHSGLDTSDSVKGPGTMSAVVKQEPHTIKEEPADKFAASREEHGADIFSTITKNLFRDPPDSTTERKPDIKKEKLTVPKLNIPPSWGSFNDPSNQEVEKILNMMTENKSPLTAIQNTPIKGDPSCKFHFHSSTPVTKPSDNLLQVPTASNSGPGDMKHDVKVESRSPIKDTLLPEKKQVKPELADDLRISEDESDLEEPRTSQEDAVEQHSPRHSGKMDTSRLSDSSSGSSSGESDDDSSSGNDTDSESDASSSDHESSPPQDKPTHKTYNLHDLINKKMTEGKKSPGALNVPKQPPLSNPPAVPSTAPTPPTLTIKETQSFPNTNQHRPAVVAAAGGKRGEGSGGFVLGINDLTTTLTPPEGYDKGSFSKYTYNDNNSINDFNKLLTERRTPLSKSPVRTSGSATKQGTNKRGPKKAPEKSPTVGKSKTASHARSDLPPKESKKGAKLNKQSSKSGAEPKVEIKAKSCKTTLKGDKKTPPRMRTPEKKSAKKPTSKEFVSDTDSSDSDDELERPPLLKKVNGTSKPHMVPSPAHKTSTRAEIKSKASGKGSRTKEKPSLVKTEGGASPAKPILDDVLLSMINQPGFGITHEPLLSPIKNEDSDRPTSAPHPQEITYKDGIPSLIVKLSLSLINRVPGRPRQPCRTERPSPGHSCGASELSYRNELLDFEEERPPPLVKACKRKQEDLEEENPVKEPLSGCKKPKSESGIKSSRILHNEELEHELSSLPDSDTVLDRRRPPERRGSTNSVSSLLSSQSSCSSSRRSDRESSQQQQQPTKRRKKATNDFMDSSSCSSCSSGSSASSGGGGTNFLHAPSNSAVPGGAVVRGHAWGSPPPQAEERVDRSQDSTSVSNDVTCTRNGHRSVGEEWGDVAVGADYVKNSNPLVARKNMMDRQRIGMEFEERQFTADAYLAEGKKLKRQADAQSDKNKKALMYFDAVLSFILCGNSMENDPLVPIEKATTMYSDTCDIIKFILKFKGSHLNQDALSMDKKLAVLCHRCQGLLYMKMFKMKKAAGMKLAKVLGEHFKNSSKSQQAPQAPSSWSSSKYTGTPSPMSPTPSPAGSVGSACSLGSQGSSSNNSGGGEPNAALHQQPSLLPHVTQPGKLTNGVPHAMSSPMGNISVPQHIVNMMSTYIQNSNCGYYGLDFWEQADILALENKEFFRELDCEFGHLTLHSSTLDLVQYARLGLRKLKNET
ncbi:AF4/FMR2 family member 4-like isoform X2 [Acanthaster planci]|uniref:AF4/FMR2 family member lilli n=1 Tax=Acanthaster planci TaxID=133434 RepID=A0A8B7YFY0_ACAPL|nr:AF4/FMR2 family member 4-like isoform X2 [Acanthaster planci]